MREMPGSAPIGSVARVAFRQEAVNALAQLADLLLQSSHLRLPSLGPVTSIEVSVTDGFGQMLRLNSFALFEIGDGSSHF